MPAHIGFPGPLSTPRHSTTVVRLIQRDERSRTGVRDSTDGPRRDHSSLRRHRLFQLQSIKDTAMFHNEILSEVSGQSHV